MCGIYGFAKKEETMTALERHKLRGMVLDLTYRNEERGKDGTGIALLSKTESLIFKEAKPSGKLLKTRRFLNMIHAITDKTRICLGHTRLATIGSVENRHCHPFVTDDFVGVHNGHFMNRETLLKKYGKSTQTPVDSEAIFRVLDGDRKTDAIAAKLSKMEGDFALGFAHKSVSHCLYLIRNAERPLHVAYVQKLKTLFWSSDAEHLKFALARNFLKASIWQIKEDQLYIADVRHFNGRSNMKKMPCKMPSFEWPERVRWDEDDFQPYQEARLFSYEELHAFGCFEGSGMDEHSKISCAICRRVTEAGELFYEEMSQRFLCKYCSLNCFDDYEERRTRFDRHRETKDLFEVNVI